MRAAVLQCPLRTRLTCNLCSVAAGQLKRGEKITLSATGAHYEIGEIGIMHPDKVGATAGALAAAVSLLSVLSLLLHVWLWRTLRFLLPAVNLDIGGPGWITLDGSPRSLSRLFHRAKSATSSPA